MKRWKRSTFLVAAIISFLAIACEKNVNKKIYQIAEEVAVIPESRCTALTQAYNGRRGATFNQDWLFNLGEIESGEATSLDDSAWRQLTLPHDWSIELPFEIAAPGKYGTGYTYGGIGWYRKHFTADAASAGKHIFIQFDGVYMDSDVWINGVHLGNRPYGYSSFEYELTDHLNFGGDNVIAVRVNNDEQPNTRWYSGSGIYRNVWLTTVNPVHFPNHGVIIKSPSISKETATVELVATVQNQSSEPANVSVRTTIFNPANTQVATETSAPVEVAANTKSTNKLQLSVNTPELWTTDSPNLYVVKTELVANSQVIDTYLVNWGFRNFSANPNTGFYMNGQPLTFQGVNQHHDLGALGAAFNCRAAERQVQILKKMGVNAIRISHNPPAPELLDIFDREGIIAIDESFDTWTKQKNPYDYHRFFEEWAERDIKDMVRRDRNHPSVFAWSIGNEIYGASVETAQNLINWVKAEDSTRMLTWASNQMAQNRDPEHFEVAALLDLQGYNYSPYAGDYDESHKNYPDYNIYGSEVAACTNSRGVYRLPADEITKTRSGDLTNEGSGYDNFAMAFGHPAIEAYLYHYERPFAAGMFIWSGFDYIGEPSPFGWPSKNSFFGVIDTAGFEKDIFHFFKSRWTETPMVHLLPHWNWKLGDTVTVYAYTNCDSVELFLNDNSLGRQELDLAWPRLEWLVPFEPGTLAAECFVDDVVVATDKKITAGTSARIQLSVDRPAIQANGRDLAFVTADILDSDGNVVPEAADEVTFTVAGPGIIKRVDNGHSKDTTPYYEPTRKAFSGKVLAIVQSSGEPGTITVNARGEGIPPSSITINAMQ